ncbi:MAG: transposase [Cryptosporangiaceae bacterium]|nr:transposase [Cryptosporangiaceae bacterium]
MEFRRDVIAVARRGDRSIGQVARSFGISESCLARWLRVADREDGLAAGPPALESEDSAELRERRKRRKRNRQLGQENEILRRAAACFAGEVLPE